MNKRTVILATNNLGKVKELQKMLGVEFDVLCQSDINFNVDVEETGNTLAENATLKANALYEFIKGNAQYKDAIIVSDDSGLFVDSLSDTVGVTFKKILGVRTARLSQDVLGREITKEERDSLNNDTLLRIMAGMTKRDARFETCLCLVFANTGETKTFTGEMSLSVGHEIKEGNGFAYDFVTISTDYDDYVCNLTDDEKNNISHRGKATKKLTDFILGRNSQ